MTARLVSSGFRQSNLPESYIRPETDRPRLSEVSDCNDLAVIDLASSDRTQIVQEIHDACQKFGFFQEIIEKMLGVANEFFSLPVEEKMKLYSDDLSKAIRLWTSSDIKAEKIHSWRDYLRLRCYPLQDFVPEWPTNPPSFKEIVSSYCTEMRELGFRLEELISESLGLDKDCIKNVLGEQGQLMSVNYYPPCPQPELTYGLPGHADPNALTILLQDTTVAGLQILIDGKWFAVDPRAHAFVDNIGDTLQALSNGRYKSVWHRAITNPDKPRLSVASFLAPCDDAIISPLKPLIENGSGAMYRTFKFEEYLGAFLSKNLDQEHCLEVLKIK